MFRFWALLLACGAGVCGAAVGATPLAPAPTLKVAAASNLKYVLTELADSHWQRGGQSIEFIWGGSVQLARQIQQGLPVALFISADEAQVAWLARQGLTQDAGHRYALGRLALVSRKGSGVPVAQGLQASLAALRPDDKLAIAHPQLAPYGQAAQRLLQSTPAWATLQKQLVLGENVGQTTQFVLSGAARLGLTAYSLTQAGEAANALQVWPVPADAHEPLPQRLVVLKTQAAATRAGAQAFAEFLLSPAARAHWLRHGYALPQ